MAAKSGMGLYDQACGGNRHSHTDEVVNRRFTFAIPFYVDAMFAPSRVFDLIGAGVLEKRLHGEQYIVVVVAMVIVQAKRPILCERIPLPHRPAHIIGLVA